LIPRPPYGSKPVTSAFTWEPDWKTASAGIAAILHPALDYRIGVRVDLRAGDLCNHFRLGARAKNQARDVDRERAVVGNGGLTHGGSTSRNVAAERLRIELYGRARSNPAAPFRKGAATASWQGREARVSPEPRVIVRASA
jgi:hypothetical protein